MIENFCRKRVPDIFFVQIRCVTFSFMSAGPTVVWWPLKAPSYRTNMSITSSSKDRYI